MSAQPTTPAKPAAPPKAVAPAKPAAAAKPAAQQAAAVPPSLTDDGFLGGRLNILQPEKGYRAGIDAVFLAATIPARAGDTLFEAGMGAGVAALCVAARVSDVHVTGVEVASTSALNSRASSKLRLRRIRLGVVVS